MSKVTIGEVKSRGYAVLIYQAIQLAGGPSAVARHCGNRTAAAAANWIARGNFPIEYVRWLAEQTQGLISADDLLAEIAKFQPKHAGVVAMVRGASREVANVGA